MSLFSAITIFHTLSRRRPTGYLVSFTSAFIIFWPPSLCLLSLGVGFHIIERRGFLKQYKLHTTAESVKKDRASKSDVIKMALFQQFTQITLGYLTADDKEVFYPHDYHISILVQKVQAAQLLFVRIFCNAIRGPISTNFEALAFCPNAQPFNTTVGDFSDLLGQQTIQNSFEAGSQSTEWQWLVSALLYWVIIPTSQFLFAFVLADTFQYFMHRAMHTKWLYSLSLCFQVLS